MLYGIMLTTGKFIVYGGELDDLPEELALHNIHSLTQVEAIWELHPVLSEDLLDLNRAMVNAR